MRLRTTQSAFTLIELMVVIAIVAVLIGMFLPAIQRVRESVNRVSCQSNLRQIGIACHGYHGDHNSLPPGYRAASPYSGGATDTSPGWGWAAFLLPYIEQDTVAGGIDFSQGIESGANAGAAASVVKLYLCPSDVWPPSAFAVPDAFGNTIVRAAPTSYAACAGGDESNTFGPSGAGVFYRNSSTRFADITDGLSHTIMIGERAWGNNNGIWAGAVANGVIMRGGRNPCPGNSAASYPAATLVLAHGHLNNAISDTDAGLDDFSSLHIGGSNFLFADGSVRFLRSVPGDSPNGAYTPDSIILQGLSTRSGNEAVPDDF